MQTEIHIRLLFFLGLICFFPGWLVGFSIPDLQETTNQFGMALVRPLPSWQNSWITDV